jgi:hypothetical protein
MRRLTMDLYTYETDLDVEWVMRPLLSHSGTGRRVCTVTLLTSR